MNKYRITETICVLCAAVFILFTLRSSVGTDKSAAEIAACVIKQSGETGLKERGLDEVRKNFSLDAGSLKSFAYFSSDDVMNVDEIFIAVLNSPADSDKIISALSSYADDRYSVFSGYAAEQAESLKNYLLKIKGNALLFCVGGDADGLLDAFFKAL